MIHLQKNVINAWCPLCLGIAIASGAPAFSGLVAGSGWASAQHDAWMADKIADGWRHGEVKDQRHQEEQHQSGRCVFCV